MKLDDLKNMFAMPDQWDVVRVLQSGREELVAVGVPLVEASQIANRLLNRNVPGVTVSLRESVKVPAAR